MTFAEQTIQDAIEDGYEFMVLEPQRVFAPAVKEFHRTEKRLVYDIDTLLHCLSKEYGWDPVASLLLCGPVKANYTIINGKPVVSEGQLTTMPIDRILQNHRRLSHGLMTR